jgi:hypothetical protein
MQAKDKWEENPTAQKSIDLLNIQSRQKKINNFFTGKRVVTNLSFFRTFL